MIKLPSGVEIGDGKPCFIIAEVGSNWASLEDCLLSIRAAKAAGADAVKFQIFTPKALYGSWSGFQGTAITEAAVALAGPGTRGHLDPAWLPNLKREADRVGIEFMCSAFSPELVKAVDPYVSIHKIASAEMTHVRILEAVRATGKPVILSTGASGTRDIGEALNILAARNTQAPDAIPAPVVLMYCVAAYPAREIDLENIRNLRAQFGIDVGYSDHSMDVLQIVSSAVCDYGAVVVEKHFTAFEGDSPDRQHSVDAYGLKLMVDRVRGHGPASRLGPTREENAMVARHNRRLIATRKIFIGEELIEGQNFGIYRSLENDSHAFSPFLINEVNGKRAKRTIEAGRGIGPGDI